MYEHLFRCQNNDGNIVYYYSECMSDNNMIYAKYSYS